MNLDGARLLVIAAHPDDETLACGGLISRVVQSGGRAAVLAMATGTAAQFGSSSDSTTRRTEFSEAMRVLGVAEYEIALPDAHHLRLDTTPRRELVALIEDQARVSIASQRPDIVAIPGGGYHQDHEAVRRAAVTALRPYPNRLKPTPRVVLGYSMFDEELWNQDEVLTARTAWVDISSVIDRKLDAVSTYASQLKSDDLHWRTPVNIREIARVTGLRVGVRYAESFATLRVLL